MKMASTTPEAGVVLGSVPKEAYRIETPHKRIKTLAVTRLVQPAIFFYGIINIPEVKD